MASRKQRNLEVVKSNSTEEGEGEIAATSTPSQAVRAETVSRPDLEMLQSFHQDFLTAERAMQTCLRTLSGRYKLKENDNIDLGSGKIIRV